MSIDNIAKSELAETGKEIVEAKKKSWVRNSNPVIMSVKDSDPERAKQKAELFNKLYRLQNRRGIAKFDSVEEMELLIEQYFYDCADIGLRPTIRGLASALGTVYATLNDWESGSRDAQLGSSCSTIIKKAKQFIAEFDEQAAIEGYDNPVLFMFRAKNYYGMKDEQDINIAPVHKVTPERTPEQIEADIPVDLD